MTKSELFKLVVNQRISKCIIRDGFCPLLFKFKGLNFCVSELIGESCQDEKIKKLQQIYPKHEELKFLLPLKFKEGLKDGLEAWEKGVEFNVYYKNHFSSSIIFLGKIIERRKKERGNNLRDLLNKAIKNFSSCVKDTSSIFIIGNSL